MKKHKKLLILTSVIIIVIAIGAAGFCLKSASPTQDIQNKNNSVIIIDNYNIEYNGKRYRYFDEAKYYEFIKDEKIFEKKDSMSPETYYTLKNDYNNDFIYVGIFRDSELYTTLPISDYKDIIKGEPTSIIISKLGYKTETEQISTNAAAIKEAVVYKTFEDSTENLKTYNKGDHDDWYYIYVFYENFPIASNVTHITVVDHHGEYLLLCSTTDNTYSGIVIENGALTDLIENMKVQQNNQ